MIYFSPILGAGPVPVILGIFVSRENMQIRNAKTNLLPTAGDILKAVFYCFHIIFLVVFTIAA